MKNAFNMALAFAAPLTFLIAAIALAAPAAQAGAATPHIAAHQACPAHSGAGVTGAA